MPRDSRVYLEDILAASTSLTGVGGTQHMTKCCWDKRGREYSCSIASRSIPGSSAGALDVVHLREQGLQRMPNGEIFTKATAEGRVVLTFDLDFGELVALSRGARTSVVVFRLRDTRTAHVIARLERVLGALAQGAVVIAEDGVRKLARA